MSLYCTTADVQRYLPPNVEVEGTNATPNFANPDVETLRITTISSFIADASSKIDSALATQYDVPLKKVNQGGDVGYPNPITTICAILTSQMIYEVSLQGADRQKSDAQKEREKWAENELMLIQNGERRLQGIRYTRASRFIKNTLYDIPKNPASENRSKGSGN